MDTINLDSIKEKGVYFKTINMDKLLDRMQENFSNIQNINEKKKKKMLMEKRNDIENKMIDIVTNSKKNIKSTVPVINNVNKQLIQNNLLLKMKMENMKQTYKNILNYCSKLQSETNSNEKNQPYEILKDIIERLKRETHKTREEL